MKSKKIVLTGGGTAGHVTANIALLPKLEQSGYEAVYIGSYNGIEKELIKSIGIRYHGISSGKLRRYFDMKNFSDPFRVIRGYFQAKKILKKEKPLVVFSKGGFVTVPVVFAARKLKIPVVSHESDMTPGLANRLCISKVNKICCNFPETVKNLPEGKAVLTGTPIREELLKGSKEKGKEICGFTDDKPIIMVIGGSLGSVAINKSIREALKDILKKFNVIHICGKGNIDKSLENLSGYKQFSYISAGLKDLYALSDILISRAGANVICEILALKKPNILVPLPLGASRGDQILNAKSFARQGFSYYLEQSEMEKTGLLDVINEVYENREKYIESMNSSRQNNGITAVMDVIEGVIK